MPMEPFVRQFVIPLAQRRSWKAFCEIGASQGASTDKMLRLPDITYTIIDPCLDTNLVVKYSGDVRVTVCKANSLDVLPGLQQPYDCILIDGDHNWYTVYNELRVIREKSLLKRGGMIFHHDIGWPYGHRDMYYQPESIPPDYRLPYARKGILRGRSDLADQSDFNGSLCNAIREGGPRNGVLAAIEEFLSEHSSDYNFCCVHLQFGLGIMEFRTRKALDDLAFAGLRAKAAVYGVKSLRSVDLPMLRRILEKIGRRDAANQHA
jgi:hypothetical protein